MPSLCSAKEETAMSLRHLPAKNPNSLFSSMRGHHAAVRVPDYEVEKRWFIDKLDFRVIHEWPYEDQHLAYVGPANDDHFYIEILGDGNPSPSAKAKYEDLSDSLRYAGFHHVCLQVHDVDATVAELRRRGVTIVTKPFVLPVIDRRLAFVADPFGNLFELAEVLA
jgi:catechol 2,3-dioxygenase-like lactoylglutathione lyase family enzyme